MREYRLLVTPPAATADIAIDKYCWEHEWIRLGQPAPGG
jgi:hypothetical protein